MSCTPERGSRQKGCLIYRLEGVFKLFLPYGLEHMGVSFHTESHPLTYQGMSRYVASSFLPPYAFRMHSSQIGDQRVLRI